MGFSSSSISTFCLIRMHCQRETSSPSLLSLSLPPSLPPSLSLSLGMFDHLGMADLWDELLCNLAENIKEIH